MTLNCHLVDFVAVIQWIPAKIRQRWSVTLRWRHRTRAVCLRLERWVSSSSDNLLAFFSRPHLVAVLCSLTASVLSYCSAALITTSNFSSAQISAAAHRHGHNLTPTHSQRLMDKLQLGSIPFYKKNTAGVKKYGMLCQCTLLMDDSEAACLHQRLWSALIQA